MGGRKEICTITLFFYQAVEFRNYWGEKSDLRRFKDGSINEAVVWEGDNKAERRLICKQVIHYLLKR